MPQPRLHWSMHLWPGLPQVWTRGSWVHLAVAVGFTALANVLAAATLVWTEWLSREVRWGALGTLAVVWLLAWFESRSDWRRMLAELSAEGGVLPDVAELADRWFREAQAAYLAGDWVSAEQALLKLLKQDARDAEARLMLATLWRHEGRLEAASEELDQLELLEAAAAWKDEIAWERERIRLASVEEAPQTVPLPAGSTRQKTREETDATQGRLAA